MITGLWQGFNSFSMSGGHVWGHLGIVEVTLGGLGTFPAAQEKQVVKSGRHIASIWEALGSVVAPLGAVGCPFADSACNNSAQKCPKDHRGGIVEIMIFFCVFDVLWGQQVSNDGLEAFLEHLEV